MVKKCAIRGCKSESYTGCSVSFFKVPGEESKRKKWLDAIPSHSNIKKYSVVCSFHFRPQDILQHSSVPKLKFNAVPTIFTKMKARSEPNFQEEIPFDPLPDFNPLITEVKSESPPIKLEEDPPLSEDPFSPSEALIPLSEYSVPLSDAVDPLIDVKVEDAVIVPDARRPVEVKQEKKTIILILGSTINKSEGQGRQKVHRLEQMVKRRDKKITELEAEVNRLQKLIRQHHEEDNCLLRRGSNQNRTIAAIKKNFNRKISTAKLDNRLKCKNLKKSLVGTINSPDISHGVKQALVIRQKSSIGENTSCSQQKCPQIGVQHTSDERMNPSVVVQPLSDVGLQRTSAVRQQNSLVIQIDGMHSTVLQPKLVRLQDLCVEKE